ncbi:MAG: ferritin-like domain-containing protein, partial [Bradymonadaceae bacterium]
MSSKKELIKRLNEAMAWELAGCIQYMQAAVMLTGHGREVFHEFFHDSSKEARDHAELVGDKIAVLGGIPTVEPARVRQAADVDGMLEAALALDPGFAQAWANRAILRDELGDAEGAMEDYRKALELDPKLGEPPS